MPEWSLESLRLVEKYLDLVSSAARERGFDERRCVARVRASLTRAAEGKSGRLVRLGNLLRAMGELGSPELAAEIAGRVAFEHADARPA